MSVPFRFADVEFLGLCFVLLDGSQLFSDGTFSCDLLISFFSFVVVDYSDLELDRLNLKHVDLKCFEDEPFFCDLSSFECYSVLLYFKSENVYRCIFGDFMLIGIFRVNFKSVNVCRCGDAFFILMAFFKSVKVFRFLLLASVA